MGTQPDQPHVAEPTGTVDHSPSGEMPLHCLDTRDVPAHANRLEHLFAQAGTATIATQLPADDRQAELGCPASHRQDQARCPPRRRH
jgi:hypothetical protein